MELPFRCSIMNIFYQLVVSVKPDFSAPTFTFAIGDFSSVVGLGFRTNPKAEMPPIATIAITIIFFMLLPFYSFCSSATGGLRGNIFFSAR